MKKALTLLLAVLLCLVSSAQIVNRLKVDKSSFERYARGRMQPYSEENLPIADSLYSDGVRKDDYRLKCLGLALEFPVRYTMGQYDRMDAAVAEFKALARARKDIRSFYFPVMHEYCQYLVLEDRAPEAMLEARDMERIATTEGVYSGLMYSHRIVGLIQSYRENHYLAVNNFEAAIKFCEEAHYEQDLPNLYILVAQENIKMQDFAAADKYCSLAEEYQEYAPDIRIKCLMVRAVLYYSQGLYEDFRRCYEQLEADRRYPHQADIDARLKLDICYLRSKGMLAEALTLAESLGTEHDRFEQKHSILAEMGDFDDAYVQLSGLLAAKDSIYIKVQNEDLAILDAEMNNAQLREQARILRAHNQITVLAAFMIMFAIAFVSILLHQWRLRDEMERMKKHNAEMLEIRRAFQQALEAKETENAIKIKILQNRKSPTIKL